MVKDDEICNEKVLKKSVKSWSLVVSVSSLSALGAVDMKVLSSWIWLKTWRRRWALDHTSVLLSILIIIKICHHMSSYFLTVLCYFVQLCVLWGVLRSLLKGVISCSTEILRRWLMLAFRLWVSRRWTVDSKIVSINGLWISILSSCPQPQRCTTPKMDGYVTKTNWKPIERLKSKVGSHWDPNGSWM